MRFAILFLFICSWADAQMLILTRPGAGGVDTSNPVTTISSNSSNPVFGTATILVTISFSKPVTGFVVGDITATNCSLSSFTAVTQVNYTVIADPIADGDFSLSVAANTCTDLRGVNNLASNTLTYQLQGGGGITYDLQNATYTLQQNYRGHTASFTDCNDLLSTVNFAGLELLYTKNNVGVTHFATTNNTQNSDCYKWGRCDFGLIPNDVPSFTSMFTQVTGIRQGNPPTVMSYKNGVTTYAATIRDNLFYGRDSRFETTNTTLTYQYINLTDVTTNPRPVLFRDDYYGKSTQSSYYQGSQATGDNKLTNPSTGYVKTVLDANGWYTNFVHWHWQMADYPDHYLSAIKTAVGSNDVFWGTVNDVVDYYYVRESVTSISGNTNTITVNFSKDYPSKPYENLRTPVWVRVDLTGTNLAGHDIGVESTLRVRKISANVFMVPIALDYAQSSSSTTVFVTTTPDYVNLTPPVINRTGNSVTVDQLSKVAVWRVHKPTSLASSSTSAALPTADNTTVNFTVSTGLTIPANMTLKISADGSNWFYATVISYNSSTGALSVSSSTTTGSGTFSSWTIQRYYHMLTAELVERNYTYQTAYTISATLDNTNYDYWVGAINRDGISNAFVGESITNITITVNPAQYQGTNVSITANTNGATVTSWKWRILLRYNNSSGVEDTLMRATSTSQNPSFSLDSLGFYDIQLTARNGTDKYFTYQFSKFVFQQARFTEDEADFVVNMTTGANTFLDRRGFDMSDKKIYIKGQTTTNYFECVDCHGRPRHPMRIQKANDNTQVTIQSTGGSAHPLYFSQYGSGQGARYVVVDGFNLDGTPGLKVTGLSGTTVTARVEGKLTDVAFYGIEIVSDPLTVDGAAIAIVPTVASDCRKDNWACNNIHVFGCKLLAGEEGVYINESNQSSGYIGNNGFNPPSGYGIVVARNTILGAGRDGIQVGSAGGRIHNNFIYDIGQQHDAGGQESFIVLNSGFFGNVFENYGHNGEMAINQASGEYAYSPSTPDGRGAGQSTPQPTIVESNVFVSGTYGAGGTDETHAIYIQNNPNSGAGNWTLTFKNNIIDTDNKCAEMLLALGGYTSQAFTFANNICIKSGDAGDTPEFNVTGNGKATLQGGTKTVNNLVRERGSDLSDLYFNDYATGDLEITSTSSAAYNGSPTTLTVSSDFFGFPIPLPVGYFFGPYSNYNKRTITP